MVKNPKFLKNLLTTASAVAIGFGATNAVAGTVKTQGANDAAFATGASWAPAGAVANGDSLIPTLVGPLNGRMVGDSNTTVTINTNNVVGSRLSVGANTVGLAGVVGGKQLEIRLTDNATQIILGLNGVAPAAFAVPAEVGSYVGLSVIDFKNTTGTVTAATDNMDIAADFLSTGGNNGHIIVDAKKVKFSGAFNAGGALKVLDLKVNDGQDTIINTDLVLTEDLILGSAAAGGTALIKTGKNVTVREIKGSADGKGILKFEGGGTTVLGKVGATTKLETIELGAGATEFRTSGAGGVNIKATNIKLLANDTVLRIAGNPANIQGIITTENANKGVIEVSEATTIDGVGTVVGTKDKRLNAIKFITNNALNVGDGVNIYLQNDGLANTGIWTGAAGRGSIAFKGNATLDAIFTAQIGNITSANDAAKTVIFTGKVMATDIAVGGAAGGTMKFGGDITANSLIGGAAGAGIAEFINENDAKIELTAIGAAPLQIVKISGKNLDFTGKFVQAAAYAFGDQAANILVSTPRDVDLSAAGFNSPITTTSTTGNQNFTIANGDLTLGAVGADGKLFGTFSTNTAGNNIIVTDAIFFASVGGKDVNVTFAAADGRVQNIGSSDKPMDTVSFTENTKVFGNAYADVMDITDNKTTTFSGIVDGGNVAFKGANAKAVFNDGSKLISTLIPTADHEGIAQFEGATTIVNGLGKSGNSIAEANFTDTANKTQSLGGDFYADKVTFLKTIAQATNKEVIFHGVVNAANTTFDLGTKGMTFADGIAAAPSILTGETKIMTTYDGSDNGQLTLSGANTTIDVSGVTKLDVVLNDTTKGRQKGNTTPISVIAFADSATIKNLGLDKLKVEPNGSKIGNTNVDWAFDADSLTFTPTDVSDKVAVADIIANGGSIEAQKAIQQIFDAPEDTAAFDMANEISSLNAKDKTESVSRIVSPTARTSSSAVTAALAQTVSSTTTARMQTLANPAAVRVTQADGVSAGAEDTLRYGAWGSPFYSQGVQKMRKGVSGYKSKTVGGTVGFDTMANDTMIVGVAATIAKTDLKHKDINAGDKTKADTLMFSIYGLQEINDDWFLQGVANFGSTKVKNTSARIGSKDKNGVKDVQTATGKYDSMSWGGELLGGYNMNITSMAVITPMLGLDYTRTNDGGFTETGTRNQNLSVSKKSVDKTQLVAGVRAVMADIEQSGFVVTPEVHGFVRQALGSKNPKLTVKLDGAGELDTSNNAKLARTTGNLGLGINASSGMMSYGLTYDAHMANKYVGHQGTFKVRVNF